jgi:hypothetical protein
MIRGHAVSMRFPRAVERNVDGFVQKQTYSENDYLLRYYGCLRETNAMSAASTSDARKASDATIMYEAKRAKQRKYSNTHYNRSGSFALGR